ncbi:hypothetical protein [Planctobacterium marinum]|uniref:hypothetical protein n=1 Tax=Planctobacterium marinum TaxID=1631968 RepID=UPI0030C780E6
MRISIFILFWLFSRQAIASESCQQALEEIGTQSDNVEIVCTSLLKNKAGQSIRAQTQVNFSRRTIKVLLDDTLSGAELEMSLEHELAHVAQYQAWFDGFIGDSEYQERLQTLHNLVAPKGLNSTYQTLARLKRHSMFRAHPERWLQAYANIHFCMEYQAWHREAEQAQKEGIPFLLMTAEVTAIVNDNEQALVDYINQATIKHIYPEGFNPRQLQLALDGCPDGNNPVDMFRSSIVALELTFTED